MIRRFLSWLLFLVNARASSSGESTQRYALKEKVLRRWGTLVGEDLQHIVKTCYDCGGSGRDSWSSYDDECERCGGSGKWDEKWIRLERWELGGRIFHRPAERSYRRPDGTEGANVIAGLITHVDVDHRVSAEAFLWLALLCDPRLFLRLLVSVRRYPKPWYRFPLLALQSVTLRARMRLNVRRCSCGRRFFTRGRGWEYCRHCRAEQERDWQRQQELVAALPDGSEDYPSDATDDDDLPF